jgi:Zn-dependent peptidase ImmA (M78 family)
MAKKKLTDQEAEELRAAYEAWNPHDQNSESAADLAKRFGISKQTLYTYRDEWLARDRDARVERTSAAGSAEAIVWLTTELAKAQAKIRELEEILDRTDSHR